MKKTMLIISLLATATPAAYAGAGVPPLYQQTRPNL